MEDKLAANSKIAIVAMGNTYRQDDAAGIRIATECKVLESEKLVVLNEGNNGISFLDFAQEIGNVIVVDAMDHGARPGNIGIFDFNEFIEGSFNLVSSHTYDIFNFVKIFDPKITIVGIQPKLTGWGDQLSDEVERAIPKAVNVIKKLIRQWSTDA